ncbi:MAG: hypothetical protein CO042_03805 [Parcubacteria group bacterium CG_4_9_14_0_2_um_filter_41_8]
MQPDIPSDCSQKRFLKACKKAGLIIDYYGGKGSHAKAIDPKTNQFITVQNKLHRIIIKEKIKILNAWGYIISL